MWGNLFYAICVQKMWMFWIFSKKIVCSCHFSRYWFLLPRLRDFIRFILFFRAGITYVSVHDCYWTHPCDVDIMNKVFILNVEIRVLPAFYLWTQRDYLVSSHGLKDHKAACYWLTHELLLLSHLVWRTMMLAAYHWWTRRNRFVSLPGLKTMCHQLLPFSVSSSSTFYVATKL